MTVMHPARGSVPGDQAVVTAEVAAIVEQRAVIEQAKGMLMFVYGVDADAAFDVLRRQSQENNVKLRLIAEQILKDLVELSRDRGPVRRLALDGLLKAAHNRVAHSSERQLDGESKTGVSMKDL